MVTEFGVSEASGAGSLNTSEAGKWLDLLDQNEISYFAWSLSNKAESSALLKSGTSKKSGWKTTDLSTAGKWVLKQYQTRSGKTSTTTSYKPGKVKSVSVKNVKGKKVKVSVKKVSKASGYQIIYSTSKSFKNGKKVNSKTGSYTIKKLKKGKTYYIKARAYRKENGKTYYGSYSSVKKVKIKS